MATFELSLRVMGTDLVPDEVSRVLGLEADEAHRKGDPRLGASGRRYADHTLGLWSVVSREKERTLSESLAALLDRFEGFDRKFEELRERGYDLDVLVGVFGGANMELVISPEVMERLGQAPPEGDQGNARASCEFSEAIAR